jgi:hypothetical protein
VLVARVKDLATIHAIIEFPLPFGNGLFIRKNDCIIKHGA